MQTKAQLIKCATTCAEDIFDKQMLDLIEIIKERKKLHLQHRTILIEYCEAHRMRLKEEELSKC